jgi:hypothetical protein
VKRIRKYTYTGSALALFLYLFFWWLSGAAFPIERGIAACIFVFYGIGAAVPGGCFGGILEIDTRK